MKIPISVLLDVQGEYIIHSTVLQKQPQKKHFHELFCFVLFSWKTIYSSTTLQETGCVHNKYLLNRWCLIGYSWTNKCTRYIQGFVLNWRYLSLSLVFKKKCLFNILSFLFLSLHSSFLFYFIVFNAWFRFSLFFSPNYHLRKVFLDRDYAKF